MNSFDFLDELIIRKF